MRPLTLYIIVPGEHGALSPKPLRSFREALAFACIHIFHIPYVYTDSTNARVLINLGEKGHVQMTPDQIFDNKRPKMGLPADFGTSCVCSHISPQTNTSFTVMAPRVKRNVTKPNKVSVQKRGRKEQEVALVQATASSIPVTFVSAAIEPPPRSDPSDDMMDVSYPAYDLLELGGDHDNITNILNIRPSWDQETLDELISWGANPKLHEVHQTFYNGKFTKVRCTMVHPSGSLVKNMWLPLSVLKNMYPSYVTYVSQGN